MRHLTWTAPPVEMQHTFTQLVRTKKGSPRAAARECASGAQARKLLDIEAFICIQNFGHGLRCFGTEELDLLRGDQPLMQQFWGTWMYWFLREYAMAGGPTPDGFVFDYELRPTAEREERMTEAAYDVINDHYGTRSMPITNWYGGYNEFYTPVVYGPDHIFEMRKIDQAKAGHRVEKIWPWVRYPMTNRRNNPPNPVPAAEIEERLDLLVGAGITTIQWWGPGETYHTMWNEMHEWVTRYGGEDDRGG